MKHTLKSLALSCKGAIDITGVVVDLALVVALIPVIKTFIADAQANLTATEYTILTLTTLIIVLALVFNIVRQSGLAKKK